MRTRGHGVLLSERIVEMARREFPSSELDTALWLLRECASDDDRVGALLDADGDLSTLVLAVEDRTKLTEFAAGRSG